MVKGSKLDIVNPQKIFAATLDTPMNISVQCSLTIKTKPTNQPTIHKTLRVIGEEKQNKMLFYIIK